MTTVAQEPTLEQLRQRVAQLEAALEVKDETLDDALTEAVDDATSNVRDALGLCPACTGVPVDSINRCDFCKAILRAIS